jgi:hypothetical protein
MTKKTKFQEDDEDDEIDFKLGNHLHPITKKLIVKFRGSLNELEQDPGLAVWNVTSSQVFGFDQDDQEGLQLLENALLVSAKIKKIQSTFPCEVAIDIKAITDKNFVTADGQSYHYITYAGEVNHDLDEVLLQPSEKLNSEYLVNHSKYTPNRLMQDVIPVPKSQYSYVGKENPVIKLINDNADLFKVVITSNDLVDDNYFKIDNSILHKCVQNLAEEFKNTFPVTNLNEFEIEIHRPGGLHWSNEFGITDNLSSVAAAERIMNMKRELSCILELEYAILNTEEEP